MEFALGRRKVSEESLKNSWLPKKSCGIVEGTLLPRVTIVTVEAWMIVEVTRSLGGY